MVSRLFCVVVLVLFSTSNLSYADDLIARVCSKTQNQQLCFQTLKSFPGADKADLKGLGRISITISLADAQSTHSLLVSLSQQAGPDKKLKDRFDTCVENYQDTIDSLNSAVKALGSGDIPTFRTVVSAALDGPGTCDDSFEGPPAAPNKLVEANKKSEGLIGIVLAVGAILDGQ